MLRALWLLFKILILVIFIVWLADLPGEVQLDAMGYLVNIDIGFFCIALITLIIASIFIHNTITTFIHFPASYARYLEIRRREKGYKALTLGLTAVAAGDTAMAKNQAARATRYLKNDTGLPLLLQAQAARMNKQEEDAIKIFARILENKDAAFLGVRGLLQTALDQKQNTKALSLAQHALDLHPNQPWILNLVYDLQTKERKWDDALKTLMRIKKTKSLPKDKIIRDHCAILIAQAEDLKNTNQDKAARNCLEQAFSMSHLFVPAAATLAKHYIQDGDQKKAVRVLEKSWKKYPHPDTKALWDSLLPSKKDSQQHPHLQWFMKLHKHNTKSAYSLLVAGRTAMEVNAWDDARDFLMRAEKKRPSKNIYIALADLERISGGAESQAKTWHELSENAPDDPCWVCEDTGRIYNDWTYMTPHHNTFNSIQWMSPDTANSVSKDIKTPLIQHP